MLSEKEALKIRILNEDGLSNVEIAMEIGCNPNTVSKYLRREWKEMKRKESKLDPFKEYIRSRLEKYPKLSSVALFKQIKSMGYSGGITTLRVYVHTIRPNEREEYKRFETLPAEQFQVDWGQGKTVVGGEKKVVKYFVMVLGYSRMLYVEFAQDEKLSTLIRCHNNAFEYFGGYCNEGLYDNMKAVVKKISRKKEYNAKFMDFANFYGFRVITHRPYNPKAKGKVERMVPFVRNNILYGQEYSNMAELENARIQWLEEANSRVHSELKEIPFERFEREKKYLNPLTRLYPIRYLETRKVRKDGGMIYQNKRYELGGKYAGKVVNLERKGGIVNIYFKDERIKTEPLKMDVETRNLKEYEEVSQNGI